MSDGQLQIDYKSQFPTATRIENGIAFDASGKQLGPVKGMEADQDQNQNAGWNEVKTQTAPADSEWKEVTASQAAAPASTDMGDWKEISAPPATVGIPSDATIQARKPGFLERVGKVFTEGIPSFSSRTVYNPKYGQQQFLSPEETMTPLEQQRHPIATGALEFAGGLTSPENIAIMAATSGLGTLAGPELNAASKIIPRLISAGFSVQQIVGAAKESKQAWDAIKRGDESEALRLITHATLSTATAVLAGQHAAGVEATPSTALGRVADRGVQRAVDAVRPDKSALQSAQKRHMIATVAHDARLTEADVAAKQMETAGQKLDIAQQNLSDGTGTQAEVDQARTVLSQAVANATKASRAVEESHTNQVTARGDIDRLNRNIERKQTPTDLKQQVKNNAAHEDFKHIAPRAADADITTSRSYLEKYHKDVTPIKSVKDVYEGLGYAKKVGIEDKIAPYVEKYGKDVITTNPAMDVHDKLLESPQADFAERGMKYLEEKYPQLLSPESLTVSEAQRVLTDLNSQNRNILENKPTIKIGTLLQADPEFAARYHAAASLREGEYGLFNERGVTGIDQLRRDERAIINVENDVRRSLPKGNVAVRGSGKSGPLRRAAAWAVRRGAEVEGARVGGPLGAATGGWLGEKFAKAIVPGDITRDQAAARSFKVEGAGQPLTQIRGEGAPSRPYEPSLSPEDMKAIQREFSPLHSELASYYDKGVHDISYQDAERQFKEDIDNKVSRGVRLEPEEKKIQKALSDQDAADALKAREEAAKKAALGPAPSATLPGKANYAMDIPNLPGGLTPEEVIGHEIAHSIVGKKMGIKVVDGVRSHLHAANAADGAHASVGIDLNEFLDDEGKVDINKMKGKIADIATTYLAGGVYQDLAYNTPFTENEGLRSDLKALQGLFSTIGFSDAESSKMIAQAAENAAHALADHLEMIEQHASTREPGLDERFHVSQERLDQISKDIENAERYRKSTRITGTGERPSKGPGAGREGGVEGAYPGGLREAGEGTDEGERGKGKPGAGARPGVPAADVTQLTHRTTEKGGEVRLDTDEGNQGMLKYTVDGQEARVTASNLEPKFRGKGVGTEMYERAAQEARSRGLRALTSDLGGQTSMDAAAVWDRLAKKHPGEIEKIPVKAGSPGYRWNLQQLPEEMKYSGPERRVAVEEGESPTGEERRTLPFAGVTGPPPEQLRLISEAKKQIAAAQTVPELTAALNRLKNVTGTEAGLTIAQHGGERMAQEIRQSRAKASSRPLGENDLRSAANEFNKSRGLPEINPAPVGEDPRSSDVADSYKNAVHSPNDPQVKASYDALKRDVKDQYHLAQRLGIKMDVKDENPYGLSGQKPAHEELHDDVRNNKHLSVWSGGAPPADHPLSEVDPETGHTYNELFRMVHDIFGHAAERHDFSPAGEESAWNLHRQMFSPEARPALATETKGQAAYTYKYGDFPPQKAAILPEQFHSRPEDQATPSGHWSEQVTQKPFGGVNPNNPEAPSKTYGFEIAPEHRHNPSALTAEEAKAYAERPEVKEALAAHPDIKLGWDTTTQGPELNIGASTDSLETAKKIAGKLDQRAIVNTKTGDEIPAGGEGKRREFPEYPLKQRLADLGGKSEQPVLDKAVAHYGITDEPRKMGYILPDGRGLDFSDGQAVRTLDHGNVSEVMPTARGENPREKFVRDTGAARFLQSSFGTEVVLPATGATPKMIETIARAVEQHPRGSKELSVDILGDSGVQGSARADAEDAESIQRIINDARKDAAKRKSALPTKMEFRTGSSVPLIENPLKVGENPSPTDVALALSKYTKTNLPGLELGKAAPEAMKGRAQDLMDDEARYQLSQNNAGQDWYTKDIAKHDDIMRQIRPELANPAKLSLFKMAEAVLSAGHEPTDNVAQAVRAWDDYNKTGEFSPVNPESGEPWGRYGIKSYGNALEILNRLIREKGEQGASDWLLSNHSVKELREYNTAKRGGRGGGIPGEPDDILPGVFVLGEKRGPFAQNLHGQEAAFTHDQWVNRSWNRWMGTADVDQDGKLVDQPRNTKERQLVKQSFEEASSNIGLTPSSLQAVLWYYEKALYEAHGVKKVGASTFSEGAQKVADDEASSFNFGENALRSSGKK